MHESQLQKIRSGETDSLYPGSPAAFDVLLAEPLTASRVTHVHFTDTNFSYEDYSQIAELPNLEEVSLYATSNTDAITLELSSLETVENLGFYETDLSDAGLAQIQSAALKKLSLQFYGDQISDRAIAGARKRLPDCTIRVTREDE